MNLYLIGLGSQLSKIRELLDMPQKELAKRLGVSRPIISAIENDPNKMTKNVAIALFTVVTAEMEVRKRDFANIKFDTWNNPLKRIELIEKLKKIGIRKIILTSLLAGVTLGYVFMPSVTKLITAGAIFKYWSKPDSAVDDNNLTQSDINNLAIKAFEQLNDEILKCFSLESFDMVAFIEKINAENE